jgi:hypothetical protein
VSSEPEFDTRFTLPAVDDPPLTETGVILMGLDAERLLTGLGLASLADDPALVALAVDQLRHTGVQRLPVGALLTAGARCWLAASGALRAAEAGATLSGSPRQAWGGALHLVQTAGPPEAGPATAAYLAACWLRRREVDGCAAAAARDAGEARAVDEAGGAGWQDTAAEGGL